MHDIDRTQQEWSNSYEYGPASGFGNTAGETELDEIFGEAEGEGEGEYYGAGELTEAEVMELAAELLEVQNDEELEQFLGSLFKKIGAGIKKIAPKVLPVLKGIAKKVLPMAGKAVGAYFGGPAGAAVGGKAAGALGDMFGLELEGLSGEDQEYEAARQFVRFAESAAKQVANAGANAGKDAVRDAVSSAASQFIPGLTRPAGQKHGKGNKQGTWIRQGNTIVLKNV
jgi:hypothetical protein